MKSCSFLTGRFFVAASLVAASFSSQAQLSFTFNFADAPGVGFNDPVEGAARQAALVSAGGLYSSMFGSSFNYTANLVFTATANASGGTLASAGSSLQAGGPQGFTAQEVVRTKVITGSDVNGVSADGVVNVNFSQPWQLNPVSPVSLSQFDFYGVLFHEFTHALGFSSLIEQNGSSLFSPDNYWGQFDRFVTDKNGVGVINTSAPFATNATWTSASVGGPSPNGGLFFSGPNAMAANGGQRVGLYSPSTWQDGSSGSHLDTLNPAYAGMMMLHSVGTGPAARSYSAIELGIMADLGYVNAIPEPSTYALMLLGMAGMVYTVRRRTNG